MPGNSPDARFHRRHVAGTCRPPPNEHVEPGHVACSSACKVDNGRVTLTGVVNSEVERRQADSLARTTFGSFSVENKLRLDSVQHRSTH
jgi:hypothetical protein